MVPLRVSYGIGRPGDLVCALVDNLSLSLVPVSNSRSRGLLGTGKPSALVDFWHLLPAMVDHYGPVYEWPYFKDTWWKSVTSGHTCGFDNGPWDGTFPSDFPLVLGRKFWKGLTCKPRTLWFPEGTCESLTFPAEHRFDLYYFGLFLGRPYVDLGPHVLRAQL